MSLCVLYTALAFIFSVALADSSDSSECTSTETEVINATIYADNWFRFWFNGELIMEDPIEFIPHQAVEFSFEAPVCGPRTFAIQAQDFGDDVTGLEYDDNCVGDGGLKAMFSDGTVTNQAWQCKTIFYGPINADECLANYDPAYHFTPPLCKTNTDETLKGRTCRSDYYGYTTDWIDSGFDAKANDGWYSAVEFTDDVVGWGVRPDCNLLICPEFVDWSSYGAFASFIWRDDLNFDNRVLCRYEYVN